MGGGAFVKVNNSNFTSPNPNLSNMEKDFFITGWQRNFFRLRCFLLQGVSELNKKYEHLLPYLDQIDQAQPTHWSNLKGLKPSFQVTSNFLNWHRRFTNFDLSSRTEISVLISLKCVKRRKIRVNVSVLRELNTEDVTFIPGKPLTVPL